ncbi:MAG: ankyrin repeat domain-containing protein [Pseudolabrys sp.]
MIDEQKQFVRAISSGDSKKFIDLLNSGIDVNFRDDVGWSPLFHAVAAGDPMMVGTLLKRGADPSVIDNSGWTPRGHARLDANKEICQLLERV